MLTATTTVTRRTESHKARRRLNFRAGRSRVVSPRRKSELYWSYRSSDYYPRPACMLAAAPPVSPIVCTRVARRFVGSLLYVECRMVVGVEARMLRRRAHLRVLHRAAGPCPPCTLT